MNIIRHIGDLSAAQKRCYEFCASGCADWAEFTNGDGSRPPGRATYDVLLRANLIAIGPNGQYVARSDYGR